MTTTDTRPPWAVVTTAHHVTYAPDGTLTGLRGHEARRFRAATAERTAERRGDVIAAHGYMHDRHDARDALYRAARATGCAPFPTTTRPACGVRSSRSTP